MNADCGCPILTGGVVHRLDCNNAWPTTIVHSPACPGCRQRDAELARLRAEVEVLRRDCTELGLRETTTVTLRATLASTEEQFARHREALREVEQERDNVRFLYQQAAADCETLAHKLDQARAERDRALAASTEVAPLAAMLAAHAALLRRARDELVKHGRGATTLVAELEAALKGLGL